MTQVLILSEGEPVQLLTTVHISVTSAVTDAIETVIFWGKHCSVKKEHHVRSL